MGRVCLRALLAAGAACAIGFGCNGLLGLDPYRACVDAECADASPPDAPSEGGACAASSDCTLPYVACHQNRCVKVVQLVEGTTNHSCVVMDDGAMWCWGLNDSGQLGRGVAGGQYGAPAPVSVVTRPVTMAAMGYDFGCALENDGKHTYVECWGSGKGGGGSPLVHQVNLLSDPIAISASSTSACALMADGSVFCWGGNSYGSIGCGDAGTAPPYATISPTMLLPAAPAIGGVAPGAYGTCAYEFGNANVHCFGNAAWGILGDGTPQQADKSCQTSTFTAPWALKGITNSDFAACTVDINGQWYCWGVNYVYFNIGLIAPEISTAVFTTPHAMPRDASNLTTQISMGWQHACSLQTNGGVECWGLSSKGEVGKILSGPQQRTLVGALPPANAIAAHRQFTCALLQDGRVMCWGDNEFDTIEPSGSGPTTIPTPTAIAFPAP